MRSNQRVFRVALTNRKDCCWNRLRQVEIKVTKGDNPNENRICAYHSGAFGRGQTKTLRCNRPMVGRYVFVRLRTTEYLTLCEVEVFASRAKKRAEIEVPIIEDDDMDDSDDWDDEEFHDGTCAVNI